MALTTMRRLQAPSTMTRHRKPAHVGMHVIAATRSWFGASAAKSRRTRSAADVIDYPLAETPPGTSGAD